MLFPSGKPFKCHEEILYLQPLIPPKRFDIFSPLTGGCSEGLGAFCFLFKQQLTFLFFASGEPHFYISCFLVFGPRKSLLHRFVLLLIEHPIFYHYHSHIVFHLYDFPIITRLLFTGRVHSRLLWLSSHVYGTSCSTSTVEC